MSQAIFLSGQRFELYLRDWRSEERKERTAYFAIFGNHGLQEVIKMKPLDLTSQILSAESLKDFVKQLLKGEADLEEILGPPVEVGGKTEEESYLVEVQAVREAVVFWLQAPLEGKVPFLAESLPEEIHRKFCRLTPKERFLAFTLHPAFFHEFESPKGKKQVFLMPRSDFYARPFSSLVPPSMKFREECLRRRQAEFATEVVPLQTAETPPGIEIPPQPEGIPMRLGELFYFHGTTRTLTRCYSSRWLLPLVWAEILYCVEENIPAQFCRVCGSLFAATTPKGDYRQVYCTPACRKKSDAAQQREAQRLYKQFLRGKLTAEEYERRAKEKGLKLVGRKRGKLKRVLLKNSST